MDKGLRIIFFGSARFSIPPIEAILSSRHKLITVVTQPTRKKGRGQKLQPTPVREFAVTRHLNVIEADNVNEKSFLMDLGSLSPDLFVIASFGQIFSSAFLKIPKLFAISIHPSLLPKYRGPSPVPFTILNKEKYTGVSIFKVIRKTDAGPLLMQKSIEIPAGINAVELEQRLAQLAAQILPEVLDKLQNASIEEIPQDETQATYTRKLKKEDGKINWDMPAEDLDAFVRAMTAFPSAFCFWKGMRVIIKEVEVSDRLSTDKPGTVSAIDADSIFVSCKDRQIAIKIIQPQDRKPMKVRDFINGYKIRAGDRFE